MLFSSLFRGLIESPKDVFCLGLRSSWSLSVLLFLNSPNVMADSGEVKYFAKKEAESGNKKSDKKKVNKEKKKAKGKVVTAANYHDDTPDFLLNKLSFGSGMSIGTGFSSAERFGVDMFGYQVFATYPFMLIDFIPGTPMVGVFYKTFSGVESEDIKDPNADVSFVVQNYLGGAGAAMKVSDFTVEAMALGGVVKKLAVFQDTSHYQNSGYSIAMGGQGHLQYPIKQLAKINAFAGGSVLVGGYSYVAVEFGINGMF